MGKQNCPDCAPYQTDHLQNWLKETVGFLFQRPFEYFIKPKHLRFDEKIDDFLIRIGLFNLDDAVRPEETPMTAAFAEPASTLGIKIQTLRGPMGPTGYFRMGVGNRCFDFEKLPRAEHAVNNDLAEKVDDKWSIKDIVSRNGMPVATGKPFWWFQKSGAEAYGLTLGFPLIVKPRRGSLSKHVYYNIINPSHLRDAIKKVIKYSPTFIVEKFLPNLTLYRATIVDDKLFIARRLPSRIIGDGKNDICTLSKKHNINEANIDKMTLARQGLTLESIPKRRAVLDLHYKITLALGAKFEETKDRDIHSDNIKMFKKISEIFGNKLLGIDFLCENIKESWRDQNCAILELNSMPNILMHNFKRKDGSMKNNVAEALAAMTLKYYS